MVRAEGRLLLSLPDPAGEWKQADWALGAAAQERIEVLVEQMKQAQGITEQLKAENAMEWVGRMNNIRACAKEIVNAEIIYV